MSCSPLKHRGCQHPSEVWWQRYQRFLLIPGISHGIGEKVWKRLSEADLRPLHLEERQGASVTCTWVRRKPREKPVPEIWRDRAFSAGFERRLRAVGRGSVAGTRRPTDGIVVHALCVHRTAPGVPRRQDSALPRECHPADTNSDAGRALGESTGLALKIGGGTWFGLVCIPGASEASRLLLHACVVRAPRGCRLGELFQRRDVPVIAYPTHQYPQSVRGFAGACRFMLVCWQQFHDRRP